MARRSTNGAGFEKPEASQRCVASGNLLFRWMVVISFLRMMTLCNSAACPCRLRFFAGRLIETARFAVKSDLLAACLAANSGFAGFSASSRAAPPSAAVFVSSL
jgi:hypothetical protein